MAAAGEQAFSLSFGEQDPAPPCVFVLFGATGDLTVRKIVPALYNLHREGLLSGHVAVLGVARRPRSDEQFRAEMLEAVREHSRTQPVDPAVWKTFAARCHYHVTQVEDREAYASLAERLGEMDRTHGTAGCRLFYLALPPELAATAAEHLQDFGMNRSPSREGFVRIVVEKPFGYDLASAQKLNKCLFSGFDESQLYRIDHYLGKETVQNIMIFRFANAIFEPLLTRQYVESVQISVLETEGMAGRRGAYYEQVGALRDMVQNHVLQMLALVTMDAPRRMDAEGVRDEKAQALEAIRPLAPEDVARQTVRGQYAGGDGTSAYRQEKGVEPDSQVETYVALKLFLDNWRWSGVPFYIRTGKRLAKKSSEVRIVFRREPMSLFKLWGCDARGPNRLVIRIYPEEGISLYFDAKVPGVSMLLRPVEMKFSYSGAFQWASPEAYEHLLLDAFCGDPTLFIRTDELEASWKAIDSIREGWAQAHRPELLFYPSGSWGPHQAERLFEDPYKRWRNP